MPMFLLQFLVCIGDVYWCYSNRDNTVAVSALGVLGNIARWGYSDNIEV